MIQRLDSAEEGAVEVELIDISLRFMGRQQEQG